MPYIVKDLPPLIPTSSGSSNTNAVGLIDDARFITLYISSSAGTASTGATTLNLQISAMDYAASSSFQTASSQFFTYQIGSTTGGTLLLTTGTAITIPGVGFRSLRLTNLTSAVASEVVARASAQFYV